MTKQRENPVELEGFRVLITGAGAGIGHAGALLFARAGAKVAVMDVSADRVEETVEAIRKEGGHALPIVGDLAQQGVSERIVEEAASGLDGLDILWCNAGIVGPLEIEGLDEAEYDGTVAINLTSPIMSCATALPYLRRSPAGSIVITSSVAGLVGATRPVYSATKFAVVGFVKSLAQRVAADAIRVNAICPGPVLTPLMNDMIEKGTNSMTAAEYRAYLVASVPLGRMAAPEEIAQAAFWLASPRSSFVTGIALPVDGGHTAR